MSRAINKTNLVAHEKALEAAGMAIKLVMRVPVPLKSIADQVIRSASSVPANLAEGHGRIGRDRSNHWRIAYASAKEVDSHLTLLTARWLLALFPVAAPAMAGEKTTLRLCASAFRIADFEFAVAPSQPQRHQGTKFFTKKFLYVVAKLCTDQSYAEDRREVQANTPSGEVPTAGGKDALPSCRSYRL